MQSLDLLNKYTLMFRSPLLENEYQQLRLKYIVPTFQFMMGATFIVSVIRFINSIAIGDIINAIIFGPLALIIMASLLLLVRYKIDWIEKYMIFWNHIIMFYQSLMIDFNSQEAFLLGQNMFAMHLVIILITDFKYSIIQFTNMILVKLLIGELTDGISYQTIMFTIVGSFVLLHSIYQINKQSRVSFLITYQENQWDVLLPLLIQDPFFLFTYDEKKLKFNLKLSNNLSDAFDSSIINIDEGFTYLLRNYKTQQLSLENFILQRIKNKQNNWIDKIIDLQQFLRSDNIIQIRYSELSLTKQTYLIIVNKKEQKLQSYYYHNKRLISGISTFTLSIHKFIGKIFRQITHVKDFNQNHHLISRMMHILSKFPISQTQITYNYDVNKKLQCLLELFGKAYNLNVQYKSDKNPILITYQHQLDNLLIILISAVSRLCSKLEIKLQQHNHVEELIEIKLELSYPLILLQILKKNQFFSKILHMLGPTNKVIQREFCKLFSLFRSINIIIQKYKRITWIPQI